MKREHYSEAYVLENTQEIKMFGPMQVSGHKHRLCLLAFC